MYPDFFLQKKLNERRENQSLRSLRLPGVLTDFCSNDYLGIVKSNVLHQLPSPAPTSQNANSSDQIYSQTGSTGSRLLTGNYILIEEVEKQIAHFHEADTALIFNSGYDANLGLLACVPQKGDTILFDQLCHASIRDGIRLSFAQSYPFAHNDLNELEKKLGNAEGNIFIVTESVFSMDGDICPLNELVKISKSFGAHLIIDEAHATGVIGKKGEGLVQQLGFCGDVFARVHTFGKALGTHGAAVLGSEDLRSYLINFARSLMYTTALPEQTLLDIQASYRIFPKLEQERKKLHQGIQLFQQANLAHEKLLSNTPIQIVIIPGNESVTQLAAHLQANGLDVRAILYPTVPKGKERLRIVLHAFNTEEEIDKLIALLGKG